MIEDYMVPRLWDEREAEEERMVREQLEETEARLLQKIEETAVVNDARPIATTGKKILDVTCGSRTIWFNKHHPAAIYCDKRRLSTTRKWKSGDVLSERKCVIDPDVQCDFTNLPFDDESFPLVIFDPPHLTKLGESAWYREKYGVLGPNWREMLHNGFRECIRVLKKDGVLIFKWSETQIPAAEVWSAIGETPLFGHHSGKKSGTFWGCFMKLPEE